MNQLPAVGERTALGRQRHQRAVERPMVPHGRAYGEGEAVAKLCVEIGMQIHRIRSVDAAIINDQLVPEFWAGLCKSR